MDHFDRYAGSDSVQVVLQGGMRYPIQIEYAEIGFTSEMIMSWSPPYISRAIVPQSQLNSEHLIPEPLPAMYDSSFVYPVPMEDLVYLYIHDAKDGDLVKVTIQNSMGM